MTGDESVCVIPAAHVAAGCRKTGTLAVDLQQAIVVEREIARVYAIILLLERTSSNLHRAVGIFAQHFAGGCSGASRMMQQAAAQ